MAILAIELHRTIRAAQIVFQVYRVVQLDRAGIAAARAQRREFRMAAVETRYFCSEVRGGPAGVQIRVALRAADVRGYGQARMSAVFRMARSATGRENLIRVVCRRVVAGIATLIAGPGAERAHLRHVARAAPRREYRMRRGHSAAAINAIVPSQPVPAQPKQRQHRKRDGQDETQTPERVRMLEIFQVNPLRQVFSCELGSRHWYSPLSLSLRLC